MLHGNSVNNSCPLPVHCTIGGTTKAEVRGAIMLVTHGGLGCGQMMTFSGNYMFQRPSYAEKRRWSKKPKEVGFEDRAKETSERAFIYRNCGLYGSRALCTRLSSVFSDLTEFVITRL